MVDTNIPGATEKGCRSTLSPQAKVSNKTHETGNISAFLIKANAVPIIKKGDRNVALH